jgi:uncharacterized protein (TIGR00730 family)
VARRIAVFCGSRLGADPAFGEAARAFGALLGRRGLGLVYGGASVGTMGVLADAALGAGAEVIGVIPRSVFQNEVAHRGLTKLHVVASMHERKALMAQLADGFVALPGGPGTFDELFEILTWRQIGLHDKRIGVVDVGGYFHPLRALFDGVVKHGFASEIPIDAFDADPAKVVDAVLAPVTG